MKSLALIFISFLLFSCKAEKTKDEASNTKTTSGSSCIKKGKNDLEKENLKGKVKAIKEVCYYAKNKQGIPTKIKLSYWVKYKYDSLGNEALKSEYDFEGKYAGDTVTHISIYKYDRNKNIIEICADSNQYGFATKFIYKYDSIGRRVEENDFDENLTLYYKTLFKYDDKGNLIEADYHENGGKLSDKGIYKYDDKNNIMEYTYYQPIDTMAYQNTFKYDEVGNEIEYLRHDGNEFSFRLESKYDSLKNDIETVEYNKKGKIISVANYKYEYDKTGNWVKKVTIETERPMEITERTIEYYP